MFKRILFPIDIHDLHPQSLIKAGELARLWGAKLFFLYVAPYPTMPMQDDGALLNPISLTEEYLLATADSPAGADVVRNAVTALIADAQTLDWEFDLQRGILHVSVAAYVKSKVIDLVITEHCHSSGVFHWLFRSADEAILAKVDVPVLVLPR